MIRPQIFWHGLRIFVQGNQNIRRQRKKFFRHGLIFQQAGEGFVAEIFQQQKAVFIIARQNRPAR